jgi:4-amino-4-deoxy-L-arabinose transferase-like glycosyltransferase
MLMGGYRPATHDSRWTWGVVTLGIVARVAAAIALGGSLHFVDEAIYLDAARRLLDGDGFGAAYTNVPAYPVILAALAGPWPLNLLLVRCAQAVVTGAGCVLILALGKRTFGRTPAVVAAVLYALDPLLVVTAGLLYPEAVAATLLMVTLFAAWAAARDDQLGASVIAGVVLGVVIQCRPVALLLLPVLALWVAWAVRASRLRRTLHVVTLAACCLLAVTPWAVRNFRIHGHVVPVQTAGLQGAPVATTEIANAGLAGALLGRVWQDPVGLARHVTCEFGHFWELYPTRLATDDPAQLEAMHREDPRLPLAPSFGVTLRDYVSALSFGTELLLAIVGAGVAWRRQRVATVLFLSVTFTYALGFALFFAKLRYRIVVLPCILLFAGVGATALASAAAAWRHRAASP